MQAWTREEVAERLRGIMQSIYKASKQAADEYGERSMKIYTLLSLCGTFGGIPRGIMQSVHLHGLQAGSTCSAPACTLRCAAPGERAAGAQHA